MTKKKSTLLEDAATVLQKSIDDTRPMADKFGLGKTLNPGPFTVAQKDLGRAVYKSDDKFPNYTDGVPTAVPPGATPPVAQEPMHKLEKGDVIEPSRGYQPQLHLGKGDSTDPTKPPYPSYDQFADRKTNVKVYVKPGQGNISPPWANETVENLSASLSEMVKKFDFKGKKSDCDEKTKAVFDKMKKEGIDVSEDQVYEMLESLYEQPKDTHAALQDIVNNLMSEISGDFSTDVNAIFEGETISDEFKTKASTIFESAVRTQLKTITEKLLDFTETNINEAVEQIKVDLTDKVDEYLNYMVQEWINENEIAIESGLKSEIVEGFISGLKKLFKESYIDIPEDKIDLVGNLSKEVDDLKEQLKNEIQKNIQFKEQINTLLKSDIIDLACEGLTKTEKEKIVKLSESLVFGDGKEFKTKITTLKENYFPRTKIVKPDQDNLNADQLILEEYNNNNETIITDPIIRMISDSISRTTKV